MATRKKLQSVKLNTKAIKIAMIQQDLQIDDLAKALFLSRLSVSARVNGRTGCRILELEKLSEFLKIPVDQLVDSAEEPAPPA